MNSNKEQTTVKTKFLSFINKVGLMLSFSLLLLILIPITCLVVEHWYEMPTAIQIFAPMIGAIIVIGIAFTPFNGMMITKKGTVWFIPDFRVKKVNIADLDRIALTFNEWENHKYSATVKLIYKTGEVFVKDYSKQFRNMKNKKSSMAMYTIYKRTVNKIRDAVSDLNQCVVTIVDIHCHITYQSHERDRFV